MYNVFLDFMKRKNPIRQTWHSWSCDMMAELQSSVRKYRVCRVKWAASKESVTLSGICWRVLRGLLLTWKPPLAESPGVLAAMLMRYQLQHCYSVESYLYFSFNITSYFLRKKIKFCTCFHSLSQISFMSTNKLKSCPVMSSCVW